MGLAKSVKIVKEKELEKVKKRVMGYVL